MEIDDVSHVGQWTQLPAKQKVALQAARSNACPFLFPSLFPSIRFYHLTSASSSLTMTCLLRNAPVKKASIDIVNLGPRNDAIEVSQLYLPLLLSPIPLPPLDEEQGEGLTSFFVRKSIYSAFSSD